MKNGYALLSQNGLLTINKKIAQLNNNERERLNPNYAIAGCIKPPKMIKLLL